MRFSDGGDATHSHGVLLSCQAASAGTLPHDYDLHWETDAARGPVVVLNECCNSPGAIKSYTVRYKRDGRPRFDVVVVRDLAGEASWQTFWPTIKSALPS